MSSTVEVTARETSAICRWLHPRLGWDVSALDCRESDGSWNGSWPRVDAVEVTLAEAASLLTDARYVHELVQLQAHYAPLRPSAELDLASNVRQSLAGANVTLSAPMLAALLDSSNRVLPPPLNGTDFLLRGPVALLALARKVLDALKRAGLSPILFGSFAAFLQRPYRLSPDVDILIEAGNEDTSARVAAMLGELGLRIVNCSARDVRAVDDEDPFASTVDVEIGSYYRVPVDERLETWSWRGLSIMPFERLLRAKVGSPRLKDMCDLIALRGE